MTAFTRALFLPIAAAFLVASCDDPTEISGHAEAEGLALMAGTEELYRYMLDDGTAPTFTIATGTYELAIVLLDQDGEPLAHEEEEGEEEEELEVATGDPSVLTWTPEAETGEEHTVLEFHGTLEVLQAGTTTMDVCLLHGGHCDFEVEIPVVATGAT